MLIISADETGQILETTKKFDKVILSLSCVLLPIQKFAYQRQKYSLISFFS
jgi:hypothetical protein